MFLRGFSKLSRPDYETGAVPSQDWCPGAVGASGANLVLMHAPYCASAWSDRRLAKQCTFLGTWLDAFANTLLTAHLPEMTWRVLLRFSVLELYVGGTRSQGVWTWCEGFIWCCEKTRANGLANHQRSCKTYKHDQVCIATKQWPRNWQIDFGTRWIRTAKFWSDRAQHALQNAT